jgi:hypothetical protein
MRANAAAFCVLAGSMWRLGLGSGAGGEDAPAAAGAARLPERPGEANCVYYLRTGACGYGEGCRYNHPRDRAAAVSRPTTSPRPILHHALLRFTQVGSLLSATRQSLIMTAS